MNVFGMGPMEVLLIVILALIVFGPAKLPEIMGQVGKAIGDFRRATSELSEEFNRTIQTELGETRQIVEETRAALTDVRTAVTEVQHDVNAAVATATTVPRIAPTFENQPRTGLNGTGVGEGLSGNGPVPGEALAAPGTETEALATPPQPELPPLELPPLDLPPLEDAGHWDQDQAAQATTPVETAAGAAEDPPSGAPGAETVASDENNIAADQKNGPADEVRPARGERGAVVTRDDLAPPY